MNRRVLARDRARLDETAETIARIRQKFPLLTDRSRDDICYATQNRQAAVKQVARDADLVIVVGSANSSNSVRLVEVAKEAGARDARRVDNASEIDPAWLEGVDRIGITSGASVPESLVQGVCEFLERHGFPPAVEEVLIEEKTAFGLPRELQD